MSAEIGSKADLVSSLISEFCVSLERDGYQLEWNVNEVSGILDGTIVPGPDACEECLVPKEIIVSILETALEGNGISVGTLRMPKEIGSIPRGGSV